MKKVIATKEQVCEEGYIKLLVKWKSRGLNERNLSLCDCCGCLVDTSNEPGFNVMADTIKTNNMITKLPYLVGMEMDEYSYTDKLWCCSVECLTTITNPRFHRDTHTNFLYVSYASSVYDQKTGMNFNNVVNTDTCGNHKEITLDPKGFINSIKEARLEKGNQHAV